MRGQAIVEFALTLPIMLFILLGVIEVFWLFNTNLAWQRGADVLADAVAIRVAMNPGESWKVGWNDLVVSERAKTDTCGDAVVTFPDGGQSAGDRVTVAWTCVYDALTGVLPDIETTIEATSVIPVAPPQPAPS